MRRSLPVLLVIVLGLAAPAPSGGADPRVRTAWRDRPTVERHGRLPWSVPHSSCSDIEACADSVERFCKRKGSSGESVEIRNNACWGRCTSGREVRVLCA